MPRVHEQGKERPNAYNNAISNSLVEHQDSIMCRHWKIFICSMDQAVWGGFALSRMSLQCVLDVKCAKVLRAPSLGTRFYFHSKSVLVLHDKPRQLFRTCQRPPNRVRDLFIRVDDIEVVYKLAAGVAIQDKQPLVFRQTEAAAGPSCRSIY